MASGADHVIASLVLVDLPGPRENVHRIPRVWANHELAVASHDLVAHGGQELCENLPKIEGIGHHRHNASRMQIENAAKQLALTKNRRACAHDTVFSCRHRRSKVLPAVVLINPIERHNGVSAIEVEKVACTRECRRLRRRHAAGAEVMPLEVHVLHRSASRNRPLVEHGAQVMRLRSSCGRLPNGGRDVGLHVVSEPVSIGMRVLDGERGNSKRNAGAFRDCLELERQVADAMELSDVRKVSVRRHEVGESLAVKLDHLVLVSLEEGSPEFLHLYECCLEAKVDNLVDAGDARPSISPVGVHASHARTVGGGSVC